MSTHRNGAPDGVPALSRSATPPQQPGVYWVECPRGSESFEFLVYSPAVQGILMHWIASQRRMVPCFADHDLCEGGHVEKTQKWRGYVFGFSHKRRKQCFLQLTGEAMASWTGQFREGVNLRGQSIKVHRTPADNGRMHIEVLGWKEAPKSAMPPDQDVTQSLFAMWGYTPSGEVLEKLAETTFWAPVVKDHSAVAQASDRFRVDQPQELIKNPKRKLNVRGSGYPQFPEATGSKNGVQAFAAMDDGEGGGR